MTGFSWYDVHWGAFDRPLCRLVDRLGSTHELEVEIRNVDEESVSTYKDIDPGRIVKSFVAFREKGRIKLIHVDRDGREYIVYPLDLCSPTPPPASVS